jgi:hypothetical protein
MTPDEAVVYSGNVFVRTKRPFKSWVSWNERVGGGPTLLVRRSSFEVSAPQGMMLESRHLVIRSETTTMWLDRVGWAGTWLGRKDCIHLLAKDEKGSIEVALTPRDGLQRAWQALMDSGVKPRPEIAQS